MEMVDHPSFVRARALSEPLRSHFPKSVEEAESWKPLVRYRALSSRVLAVAHTRVECRWVAFIDAVPGRRHQDELQPVLDYGATLDEAVARLLFPYFDDVPYAD